MKRNIFFPVLTVAVPHRSPSQMKVQNAVAECGCQPSAAKRKLSQQNETAAFID